MKAKTGHSGLTGVVSLGSSRIKAGTAKNEGLLGIVPVAVSSMEETVSIAGSEPLVRMAGEMYANGDEQGARNAMREAIKVAMQRLEANHGVRSDEPMHTSMNLDVAWTPGR